MWFEEFQDGSQGGHLGCRNGAILASRSDASHKVSAQSDLWFGRSCHLKKFQDGRPGYLNETILAILNLYVTVMPPIKFRLNPTYGLGGDVV